MKLITIKTYSYPHESGIARSLLESEGIETFVLDEIMGQVNPFYTNAIGGIKLQVREGDVGRALDILQEKGLIKEVVSQEAALDENLSDPLRTRRRVTYRMLAILVIFIAVFIYYMFQNA